MPLITLIVTLLVVGFILWLINVYAAKVLDPKIKLIINIVVVLAVILWLCKVFGVWDHAKDIKVGMSPVRQDLSTPYTYLL